MSQKSYNYSTNLRDSIITTDKRFVNIDNGRMVGTRWICLSAKDNISFYFDSFGGWIST